MRRKIYDLADTSPIATEVLRRTALLYVIDDDVRGSLAPPRRSVRTEHSRVIIDELHQYPIALGPQVCAKSKLGEAIRYAPTRWDGRVRFLDDRRIDLNSKSTAACSSDAPRSSARSASMAFAGSPFEEK